MPRPAPTDTYWKVLIFFLAWGHCAMSPTVQEILAVAVSRNVGVVVSMPSAGLLRHHKSRFLAADDGGYWIESVHSETLLIEELIDSGRPVWFSFRSAGKRVTFSSPLKREEKAYQVNEEMTTRALLVAAPAPDRIKFIQRRSGYRVSITSDTGLIARVWRISPKATMADRPMRATELNVEVKDFSVGGLGVIFRPDDAGEIKVGTEDRLRVELTYGQVVLLLEGRMRLPNKIDQVPDQLRTGIQFKPPEGDMEGRKQFGRLNGILGELQRGEIRRFRLGLDDFLEK
jgi:hypothetical protein